MERFRLDPRLEADSMPIRQLRGFDLRLMKDARWPWLLVIPMREGIEEWHDLSSRESAALNDLVRTLSSLLRTHTSAEKINVAALGNIVRQFHVHIVARQSGDANWPGPVWGFGAPQPYSAGEGDRLIRLIADALE